MAVHSEMMGRSLPRISAGPIFAQKKWEKRKKVRKGPGEGSLLPVPPPWGATLMERNHFQKCGPKFLSGQGIGVVKLGRLGSPALGDGPHG
jgi:hypothetical protein